MVMPVTLEDENPADIRVEENGDDEHDELLR